MATQRQSLTVQLAHAKIRIAELETLLTAADGNIRMLAHELSVAQMPRAQTPARIAYMARPRSTEPSAFQLACAAAKAAAMAGGIVTRVGV